MSAVETRAFFARWLNFCLRESKLQVEFLPCPLSSLKWIAAARSRHVSLSQREMDKELWAAILPPGSQLSGQLMP